MDEKGKEGKKKRLSSRPSVSGLKSYWPEQRFLFWNGKLVKHVKKPIVLFWNGATILEENYE